MGENYLFREDPKPVREYPVADRLPIHVPSLVLGILSLVGWVLFPLVGMILGFVGRCTEAGKEQTHSVVGGRICCNMGMAFAGFTMLLNWLTFLIL